MNSAMKDMFDPLYDCEKILKEALEQEVIDKKEEAARWVMHLTVDDLTFHAYDR
jgi:hypothetical protein